MEWEEMNGRKSGMRQGVCGRSLGTISNGRMVPKIHFGNLTRNWPKNYSESSRSESNKNSHLSSVPMIYPLPFNSCHREDPTSLYELRNTIQVVPFDILPQGVGSWPRDAYGTMLSTVILVKRNGEVLFVERDIWGHGPDDIPVKSSDRSTDRVFRFKIAVIPPAS